jgi:hypothetical protein
MGIGVSSSCREEVTSKGAHSRCTPHNKSLKEIGEWEAEIKTGDRSTYLTFPLETPFPSVASG